MSCQKLKCATETMFFSIFPIQSSSVTYVILKSKTMAQLIDNERLTTMQSSLLINYVFQYLTEKSNLTKLNRIFKYNL